VERKYTFKQWLDLRETATSTGDVAGFQRITLPMVTRMWAGSPWNEVDPFFKKKKKKLEQKYHIDNKEVDALYWRYK
jgi:hypothetical protein